MDSLSFRKLSLGDLLFWSPATSAGDDAFNSAVSAAGGNSIAPFHVSLIAKIDLEDPANTDLIHATDQGVIIEKFRDYCKRLLEVHSSLDITHCTIDSENVDQETKRSAIEFAISKAGCEYNDVFSESCRNSSGCEAYYCCQLVRKSYEHTLGRQLFNLQPLNFRNADGSVIEYWLEYFKKRGKTLPENEKGSNPAGLMKSDCIRVVEKMRVQRGKQGGTMSNSRL